MKERSVTRGTIMVLITAVCFGATGIAAKLAYAEGATPIFVLVMRFTTAAILLWIYNLVSGRMGKGSITRKQLLLLFLAGGIFNFTTTMCYFNAIVYIPVSLNVMILYLYPVLINLFSAVILKERMMSRQVIALVMAFSGIVMMVWAPGIYINWFGVLLAAFAALSNSSYVLMLGSRLIEELDSITVSTYVTTFAAVSFLITGAAANQLGLHISVGGWGAILFIALFCTVIATIALYLGVKEIGASRASIICTFEPVVAALLGILILKETLTVFQAAGAVLIIAAVVIVNTVKTPTPAICIEEQGEMR